MEDFFSVAVPVTVIFIALPWLIFHYVTKWKTAPKITQQDETLLDEMHQLSRRLEERLVTVERIIAADNPDWRPGHITREPREDYRLEDRLGTRETARIDPRDTARIERSN